MLIRRRGVEARLTAGPSASAARAGIPRLARGFYPPRCPPRRWLELYATRFDTVEVNATFYRLAPPEAVLGWVEQTPADFVFAVKASRYLTHVERLTDLEPGIARFFEHRAARALGQARSRALAAAGSFPRDDDRLAGALAALPPGRHAFEFRHPSWFAEPVYALLRAHGAALVFGDHPERPFQPSQTTDWTFLRFHYGHRGRRGNYSDAELRDGRPHRGAGGGDRGVRLLQQRLGGLRAAQRGPAAQPPGGQPAPHHPGGFALSRRGVEQPGSSSGS